MEVTTTAYISLLMLFVIGLIILHRYVLLWCACSINVSACDLTNLTRPMCGVCMDFAYLNIYVHEKRSALP